MAAQKVELNAVNKKYAESEVGLCRILLFVHQTILQIHTWQQFSPIQGKSPHQFWHLFVWANTIPRPGARSSDLLCFVLGG